MRKTVLSIGMDQDIEGVDVPLEVKYAIDLYLHCPGCEVVTYEEPILNKMFVKITATEESCENFERYLEKLGIAYETWATLPQNLWWEFEAKEELDSKFRGVRQR